MTALKATMNNYSLEAERQYYSKAKIDRCRVPYQHLNCYINSSFGAGCFNGMNVLDVGAGEGVYAAYLADIEKAKRVVAFDLTPHRMRVDFSYSLKNLHFIGGDV